MAEVIPAILVKSKEEFIGRINAVAPYVSRVQWDIMDGKQVDNVTFSDPAVLDELYRGLQKINPDLHIEADLMVSDPQNWVERLRHPGIDRLIFHVESKNNLRDWEDIFSHARSLGFKVGIANEPQTPLNFYLDLLPLVDRYQAMGGRSGFGGQEFNPAVLEAVKKVRKNFPRLPISVDIGVNQETAPEMVKAGVTILNAGSAIYKAENIRKAIQSLKRIE